MADRVKRIQAAVIDGTAQSPRFKQQQMVKLCHTLLKSRAAIVEAIQKDHGYSPAEAHVHFYLALSALKELYSKLDFEKLLEDEYCIARGKDNPRRSTSIGCACIVATQPHDLYSIVVPVGAAIAAGNCVILEIQQTLSTLSELLRRILPAALDMETFTITQDQPDPAFIERHCTTVNTVPKSSASSLSDPDEMRQARVVAIVDRSADLMNAAREIVRARFSFCGSSSYAPDLVLVNEFYCKDFCNAVAQCALTYLSGHVVTSSALLENSSRKSKPAKGMTLLKQFSDDSGGATTLFSGSRGTVGVVKERSSKLLRSKVTEPLLLIHAISSTEDAIDLVNSSGAPLLASYQFAAPANAKYLSQFINARISCTNHIPIELLVGPPSPSAFQASVHPRYTLEMFSNPRPEFIKVSDQSAHLAVILDQAQDDGSESGANLHIMVSPLEEPLGGAIGFFEQGLITGVSLLLGSFVVGMVLIGKYVVPTILTKFGSH